MCWNWYKNVLAIPGPHIIFYNRIRIWTFTKLISKYPAHYHLRILAVSHRHSNSYVRGRHHLEDTVYWKYTFLTTIFHVQVFFTLFKIFFINFNTLNYIFFLAFLCLGFFSNPKTWFTWYLFTQGLLWSNCCLVYSVSWMNTTNFTELP